MSSDERHVESCKVYGNVMWIMVLLVVQSICIETHDCGQLFLFYRWSIPELYSSKIPSIVAPLWQIFDGPGHFGTGASPFISLFRYP